VDAEATRQAQAAYLGAPPEQQQANNNNNNNNNNWVTGGGAAGQQHQNQPQRQKDWGEGGSGDSGETKVQNPVQRSADEVEALLDHYQVLDIPHDFTAEELRKAYRKMSLAYHPDKKHGTPGAFARVNSAHQVLSGDPEISPGTTNGKARREWDEAWAVPASHLTPEQAAEGRGPFLRDEVTERYFPEAVAFHPFGDPFEDYPERRERREALKQAKEARAASLWNIAHPVTPFTLESAEPDSEAEAPVGEEEG
jgi:hypothetical protein